MFSYHQGQEELYKVVAVQQDDIARKKKKKRKNLQKKLLSVDYVKAAALTDGKEDLANKTLDFLRTRMTHVYLNIQQQKNFPLLL